VRIVADREICAASGVCAMTAPNVFDQDDEDGRVLVLADRLDPANHEATRRAVSLCPTGALSLEDDDRDRLGAYGERPSADAKRKGRF
jgi:ferredoxin